MTFRHLKIFIAVAQTGSMSAAARELYIAQPTVSQVIAEIENEYGIRLFERLSRRLYITREGRQLLDYARHITALFEEMERDLHYASREPDPPVGATITVGSCILPALVARFEAENPSDTVEVLVDNTRVIEEKILSSELDFGLVEGDVTEPDLLSRPVLRDELVLICAEGHPFCSRTRTPWQNLEGEPFVLREPGQRHPGTVRSGTGAPGHPCPCQMGLPQRRLDSGGCGPGTGAFGDLPPPGRTGPPHKKTPASCQSRMRSSPVHSIWSITETSSSPNPFRRFSSCSQGKWKLSWDRSSHAQETWSR